MFHPDRFKTFVTNLGLAHFSHQELLTKIDRKHNHPPEPEIWDHIGPSILVLDKLRAEMGIPIRLNSVYRSYEYNRRLSGSAKRSQHIAFNAIDFATSNRDLLDDMADTLISWRGEWFAAPAQFGRIDVVVEGKPLPTNKLEWRGTSSDRAFKFRGGVSLYSSFVHIDTRGYDVGW